MATTQLSRNLAIDTALGTDKVLISGAVISEQLGRPFHMDVQLSSEDPNLSFDAVVGTNATIRVELAGSKTPRYFNGVVSRFVQNDAQGTGGQYQATLVPWLWLLTRTSDCRIFQNMSVPDIIKKVFRDHGMTDFKDSLDGTYTAWENCVQYRETDFNFVSRLMEHEGIYYFFEHENGKHTMVLADSSSAHSSFTGYDDVPYHAQRGGQYSQETIQSWTLEQEIQPGAYALNDFNFEKPKTSLVAQSNITADHAESGFPVYDYPGEYSEQSDGSDYAKIRIEELHAQHEVVQGSGNARGLATGYTFTLTGAPRRDQNRKYLITSATYHLTPDDYKMSAGSNGQELFVCNFAAIDATKPFRAARTTPKPLIQGPQTAIVVGPSGEEIHTDKYGRIKLQFHWDRYGKADENSSCWVRISQAAWAGKKWGSMYIPRVGQEVIVEHLEGDPDLPIVTGRVYNADCMPPYELPANKTMTTHKSSSSKGGAGFNEMRFEDKKGSEQIFVHGERNLDTRIKNDAFEWIGHDQHLIVTNLLVEHVELDHHETIDQDHISHIKRDVHTTVDGKEAKAVTGSLSLQVTGDVAEVFKGNHSEGVTSDYYLKAANIVLEATTNITIKVGGSYIAIEAGGITINTSGTLDLQSTGPLTAKSSATSELSAPSTSVKGDGMVQVQGGIVKIN